MCALAAACRLSYAMAYMYISFSAVTVCRLITGECIHVNQVREFAHDSKCAHIHSSATGTDIRSGLMATTQAGKTLDEGLLTTGISAADADGVHRCTEGILQVRETELDTHMSAGSNLTYSRVTHSQTGRETIRSSSFNQCFTLACIHNVNIFLMSTCFKCVHNVNMFLISVIEGGSFLTFEKFKQLNIFMQPIKLVVEIYFTVAGTSGGVCHYQ